MRFLRHGRPEAKQQMTARAAAGVGEEAGEAAVPRNL
jgi:hypothetical protein